MVRVEEDVYEPQVHGDQLYVVKIMMLARSITEHPLGISKKHQKTGIVLVYQVIRCTCHINHTR
jgi:hypothetical protein